MQAVGALWLTAPVIVGITVGHKVACAGLWSPLVDSY